MSLWQDKDDDGNSTKLPASLDVVFKLDCKSLPVDHCATLSNEILRFVPWLRELPGCGVHPIHVAGSQNGWERPTADDGKLLLLSKRTRLRIRVANAHAARLTNELQGMQLSIEGHSLQIGEGSNKLFSPSDTLFSRYTVFDPLDNHLEEQQFVEKVIECCKSAGFQPTKVLCGKTQVVTGPEGRLHTRSVMLADVPPAESLSMQQLGIGNLRLMGCGIVLQHKSTASVA